MNRLYRLLWGLSGALLLGLLLSGCTRVDLEAPPTIEYGRDVCARCGMIIDDARFAAGYIMPDGAQRIFDDIGDMLVHQADSGEAVHAYWVHDYESEAWVRAETATYVKSDDLHTPMGYGLVALQDAGQAAAIALRFNGTLLTFDELRQTTAMLTPGGDHSGHNH